MKEHERPVCVLCVRRIKVRRIVKEREMNNINVTTRIEFYTNHPLSATQLLILLHYNKFLENF